MRMLFSRVDNKYFVTCAIMRSASETGEITRGINVESKFDRLQASDTYDIRAIVTAVLVCCVAIDYFKSSIL